MSLVCSFCFERLFQIAEPSFFDHLPHQFHNGVHKPGADHEVVFCDLLAENAAVLFFEGFIQPINQGAGLIVVVALLFRPGGEAVGAAAQGAARAAAGVAHDIEGVLDLLGVEAADRREIDRDDLAAVIALLEQFHFAGHRIHIHTSLFSVFLRESDRLGEQKVAVVEVMQRLSELFRRGGLAVRLQTVADVVQLVRVVPVVIQHVVQQGECLLGAHGVCLSVRMGVDMGSCAVMYMFVIVHGNHPFCFRGFLSDSFTLAHADIPLQATPGG